MATARKRSDHERARMYVYGSAVQEPQSLPKRGLGTDQKRYRRTSRQVRKNRNRAMSINPAYACFLALAAVIVVILCVGYLRLQSEIVNRSENITRLQKQLSTMTEANDTAMQAAEDSVNMDEIRLRAVNGLGMVYAAQGQVIEYKAPAKESVTQYSEIPANGILAKEWESN